MVKFKSRFFNQWQKRTTDQDPSYRKFAIANGTKGQQRDPYLYSEVERGGRLVMGMRSDNARMAMSSRPISALSHRSGRSEGLQSSNLLTMAMPSEKENREKTPSLHELENNFPPSRYHIPRRNEDFKEYLAEVKERRFQHELRKIPLADKTEFRKVRPEAPEPTGFNGYSKNAETYIPAVPKKGGMFSAEDMPGFNGHTRELEDEYSIVPKRKSEVGPDNVTETNGSQFHRSLNKTIPPVGELDFTKFPENNGEVNDHDFKTFFQGMENDMPSTSGMGYSRLPETTKGSERHLKSDFNPMKNELAPFRGIGDEKHGDTPDLSKPHFKNGLGAIANEFFAPNSNEHGKISQTDEPNGLRNKTRAEEVETDLSQSHRNFPRDAAKKNQNGSKSLLKETESDYPVKTSHLGYPKFPMETSKADEIGLKSDVKMPKSDYLVTTSQLGYGKFVSDTAKENSTGFKSRPKKTESEYPVKTSHYGYQKLANDTSKAKRDQFKSNVRATGNGGPSTYGLDDEKFTETAQGNIPGFKSRMKRLGEENCAKNGLGEKAHSKAPYLRAAANGYGKRPDINSAVNDPYFQDDMQMAGASKPRVNAGPEIKAGRLSPTIFRTNRKPGISGFKGFGEQRKQESQSTSDNNQSIPEDSSLDELRHSLFGNSWYGSNDARETKVRPAKEAGKPKLPVLANVGGISKEELEGTDDEVAFITGYGKGFQSSDHKRQQVLPMKKDAQDNFDTLFGDDDFDDYYEAKKLAQIRNMESEKNNFPFVPRAIRNPMKMFHVPRDSYSNQDGQINQMLNHAPGGQTEVLY